MSFTTTSTPTHFPMDMAILIEEIGRLEAQLDSSHAENKRLRMTVRSLLRAETPKKSFQYEQIGETSAFDIELQSAVKMMKKKVAKKVAKKARKPKMTTVEREAAKAAKAAKAAEKKAAAEKAKAVKKAKAAKAKAAKKVGKPRK